MKNAAQYEKKIKKLLSGARKAPVDRAGECDVLTVLVRSVLEADATAAQAARAFGTLQKEFVDFNELRVSQPREIGEYLGKNYPFARRKAESLTRVLNGIFYRNNDLCTEYMAAMPKRELRRHLLELGLGVYEAACVVLMCFGGHAVPVDRDLTECLEMNGLVAPGSELLDVQGFLERVIAQKDALTAHAFFRKYVDRHAKALARKRRAEAEAAARAARKVEAEKKAKAAAEARKRAEAEKKAKKRARKKPKGAAATRKRRTRAKAAKKARKAPRKPAAKRRKTRPGGKTSTRRRPGGSRDRAAARGRKK